MLLDALKKIVKSLNLVLFILAFTICVRTAAVHAAPWVLVSIYYGVICLKIMGEEILKK